MRLEKWFEFSLLESFKAKEMAFDIGWKTLFCTDMDIDISIFIYSMSLKTIEFPKR